MVGRPTAGPPTGDAADGAIVGGRRGRVGRGGDVAHSSARFQPTADRRHRRAADAGKASASAATRSDLPATRLAAIAGGRRRSRREAVRAGGEEPVVAVGSWGLAGELGVYCTGHPAIYSIGVMYGDRSSQYDLWRPNPVFNPNDFRGKTFVLVGCVPEAGSAFDSVESSREVVYAEGDQPVQACAHDCGPRLSRARHDGGIEAADVALNDVGFAAIEGAIE